MGCCASTSRRAQTSTPGPLTSSNVSPRNSMIAPDSASPTEHRTKPCNDGRVNTDDDDS
jgi:hypothetical protein